MFAAYNGDGSDSFLAPVVAPPLDHNIVASARADHGTEAGADDSPTDHRDHTPDHRDDRPVDADQLGVDIDDGRGRRCDHHRHVRVVSARLDHALGALAAAGDNNKKKQGPPLIVVVLTLVALGVLGGIAALRRYRRSAIDWFSPRPALTGRLLRDGALAKSVGQPPRVWRMARARARGCVAGGLGLLRVEIAAGAVANAPAVVNAAPRPLPPSTDAPTLTPAWPGRPGSPGPEAP